MALTDLLQGQTYVLAVVLASLALFSTLISYLFARPPFPKNAPRLTSHASPIIGSLHFFTRRWDFVRQSAAHSHTRNFSFYAGSYPVVNLDGRKEALRKLFFESKNLDFNQGYQTLLGGSPDIKEGNNPLAESVAGNDNAFSQYFQRRLIALLKGPNFAKNLPTLLNDARVTLDTLAAKKMTNPFDSIYRLVFLLTMRTVAATEIANDPALLERCLKLFETIEQTGTPFSVMYPWMPVPAKFQRMYAGYRLYMIFKKVVDARKKEDRREDDALQYLMDQGDDIGNIITFVLGALFAGQLNSGINASWILVYLASKPEWQSRIRAEVNAVADRYSPDDKTLPLRERLMHVPIETWETGFPLIDLGLKDSIRLQMSGTAFRRNISGHDIPLDKTGGEVIPAGAYVSLAVGDMHYNNSLYANEGEWDPERYMPSRAEDKKEQHAWVGWGVGRHPCLGMRFAKLENNLIVAFFLAYFEDIRLCDAQGNTTTEIPRTDRNNHTAHKPATEIHLKYKVRTD